MNTPLPTMTPERVRECDCPPYVLRCSHQWGQLLVLTDSTIIGRCRGANLLPGARYRVNLLQNGFDARCLCPQRHAAFWQLPAIHQSFDDYDDALAAFYAAEENLLQGTTT